MSQTTELIVKLRQVGGEQLTQLANKLNYLGKQTAATSTNFKNLSDELRRTQATSVQSINNLKGYANAWREIANSVDIASQEFKQATAEAAKLDAQVAKAQGRGGLGLRGAAQVAGTAAAGGIFGGPEGFIGGILGGVIGKSPSGAAVGAAIGGQIGMFRQQISGLASYNAEIEKQRIALKLVTQDATSFADALSFIDQRSRALAIPQEQVTRLFTQLSASVIGAGGNIRDAQTAFNGIAAGIRGTGGSLQDLEGALRATAQVFSKGKVSAEELRQQIGERLPGAFTLFAQSVGKTPQELDKALESGTVSLQDFIKFSQELFKRYGKNAEIIAQGPQSAGDRLQAALSRLSESVGRLLAPVGAAFQSVFADIVNAIDRGARALARFMGMKFFDQTRINEVTGDIARLKKELTTADAKGRSYRENLIKVKEAELKTLEAMRPKVGAGMGRIPESRLPGIVAQGGGGGSKEAEREAKREEQLAVRRKDILRNVEDFRRQLGDKIADTNDLIQGLGANAIQIFERDYDKRVREAGVTTDGFKSKVEDLAAQFAKAGGKLDTKDLVDDINMLDATLKSFAQQEYTQNLGDFFRQLDKSIIDINERVYENARALQYNADAIGGLKDGLISYSDGVGTVRQAFANLSQEGVKGIEDAIISLATTGTANFNQFATSILQATARMILQQFVLKSIMQAIGGIGGSAIAPLTGISVFNPMATSFNPMAFGGFSFGMGGIMTKDGPLDLKRYANGGIANSPQLAMFGEGSRPEAYVPLPDGRTIPVTIKNGTTGSTNVVVNVDAKGTNVQGDNGQSAALGRAVSQAVQAELIKQRRPGGLLTM